MSEKIEPALSADRWKLWRALREDFETQQCLDATSAAEAFLLDRASAAECIAIYNDALPDSDARKITREQVEIAAEIAQEYSLLQPLADALKGYMPPEEQ